MIEVLSEAPTANAWLAAKRRALLGERADMTLDIRTLRKDVMSAVATGALSGVGMPLTSGTLASLSAAVAHGRGEEDIAELPRFFRECMGQAFD
jgi:3-hydroxyisobutyrate dehydrogenase-like beta-hydroxyacid dehydrogenase